ncbi:MAG TPA: hypothetical protein VND54_03015 [Candidatus Saccharimonadales bacterium]|nr:hypothetical protein [Candidatus Saccharimonadales bacterium]
MLFDTPINQLIVFPPICVVLCVGGAGPSQPSGVFKLAYWAHEWKPLPVSWSANDPWTVSAPVKLTWTLKVTFCPLPPLEPPGIEVPVVVLVLLLALQPARTPAQTAVQTRPSSRDWFLGNVFLLTKPRRLALSHE